MSEKTKILNKKQLDEKIHRLAWEIYERNYSEKELIIVGVKKRGVELSERISYVLRDISDIQIKSATVSVDKEKPLSSDINIDLDEVDFRNKVVILVDDVLNSGKTLIYAAKQFLSVPLIKLSTVVLVNRNHNIYPIKADYVGISLSTSLQEHVNVVFGKKEGVYLS
mgnify:CR=1 FL=1